MTHFWKSLVVILFISIPVYALECGHQTCVIPGDSGCSMCQDSIESGDCPSGGSAQCVPCGGGDGCGGGTCLDLSGCAPSDQVDEVDQVDQVDQVDETSDQVDEASDQVDEVDQVDQVDQVDETGDQVDEVDQVDQVDQVDEVDETSDQVDEVGGPCGTGVCGHIYKSETSGTDPLNNIPVTLRNPAGIILATVFTNAAGAYAFPIAPNGGYIQPETGRKQSTSPSLVRLVTGQSYDFKVRGLLSEIKVFGVIGSFVILTPNVLAGPPPTTGPNVTVYSATIDLAGSASIKIPYGTYYLTCYTYTTCSGIQQFVQGNSQVLNGGNPIAPQSNPIPIACGPPVCP